MLTLKEPIKLNCINDILTVPQEMNEKILANYTILAAQFGAEDLLFLLGSEVGLPDDMGMTTTIAIENDNKITQKLDIEVINNVVNRVLLGESTSFTYQDEVYISMVLQKLGIRDVKLFMSEAHTLIEENKNVYELLKIYKENSEVLRKVTNIKDGLTKNKVENKGENFEGRKPVTHPYYIHNEIYSRLETNKIYSGVKEFQKNSFGEWRKFSHNELKIAEQSRVSNLLSLYEQKQRINSNSSTLLTHHTNVFETGVGEAELVTQQQVLERANAAMLINTIDNVLVSRLPQMENKNHYWLNIENAANKLAENTLYRFQIYHKENHITQKNIRNSSNELNVFFQEEKNVLKQFFNEIYNDNFIVKSFETIKDYEASKVLVKNLNLVQKINSTEIINTEENESKVSISNTELTDLTKKMLLNQTIKEEKRDRENREEKEQKKNTLVHLPIEEILSSNETQYFETERQIEKVETYFAENETEATDLALQMPINHIQIADKRVKSKEIELAEKNKILAQLPAEERLLLRSMPYLEAVEQLEKVETFFAEGKAIVSQKEIKDSLEVVINNKLISADMKRSVLNQYEALQQIQLGAVTNIQQLIHKNIELTEESIDETNVNLLGDIINKENPKIQEFNNTSQSKMQFYSQNIQEQNNENIISENFNTKKDGGTSFIDEVSQISNNTEMNQQQINQFNKEISELNKYTAGHIDKSQTEISSVVLENQQQLIHKTEMLQKDSENDLKKQGEREKIAKTEDLKKQLDDINNRNKVIYDTIQKNIVIDTKHIQNIPDRGKILDSAFKSIDNPQQVIEELLNATEASEKEIVTSTPMVNAILSQADDVTRKIYETVMAYEKNPNSSWENGLVKQVGASTFNMDIRDLEYKNEAQFTNTILKQNFHEKIADVNSIDITDSVAQFSQPKDSLSQVYNYPKQQFIHKRTESLISNELIEGLERQQAEQHKKIESNETITSESVKKTEVNNITNEIINKNVQDITEVINRTLARQIGDISDKVFSQMERRLQMERARRGRF